MAFKLADRVKETTTSTGTGNLTLAGTVPTGYLGFEAVGEYNRTYYSIVHQTSSEWEIGIGYYIITGDQFIRETVLSSSNANSLVNFSSGTKDVFCTYSADAFNANLGQITATAAGYNLP